jgi:mono/diheme cytochrome c family protein
MLYGRGTPGPLAAAPDRYRLLRVPELWVGGTERRAHGRLLFHEDCQPCHGPVADGNGLRADGVTIRPANLRGSKLLARSTPKSLFATIRDGVPGTPMHGWPGLTDDDTWDLVAWILGGTP